MVINPKSLNSFAAFGLCVFFSACSMYKAAPSTAPVRVFLEDNEFKEADANNDEVIDKEEVAAYLKKKGEQKKEDNKLRALWVWIGILALSLGLCTCTPGPASHIKKRLIALKDYLKMIFFKLWRAIKKKNKK